jgi:hypothetical protein
LIGCDESAEYMHLTESKLKQKLVISLKSVTVLTHQFDNKCGEKEFVL